MDIDRDELRLRRDRRLRRRILVALKNAADLAPAGRISGPSIVEQLSLGVAFDQGLGEDGMATKDDQYRHALRLLREMASLGFVAEHDQRKHPERQRWTFDVTAWSITARGVELWSEAIPPHAMIQDDRVEE